jgi:transcription antitermination factor NusG
VPKETVEQRERYKSAESVRIMNGPLAGFMACIELDKGHEIVAWVDAFKGRVKATFKPEALSPTRRSYR